jgi:chemotaxis protein methyltransferase CheR
MNLTGSSNSSLDLLMDLIHHNTGLYYSNGRKDMVVDKLLPLVADRGLSSFLDYYYLLKYSEDAQAEWRRVETALAVNETYFWREYDQIAAAVNTIIPQLQTLYPHRPIRIWHAACATGEEPYTMAIALLEANQYQFGPIEILATDFNSDAIALARAGVFGARSFRKIPSLIEDKYFKPLDKGRKRVIDSVRSKVRFSHLNLLNQKGMDAMRDFDLIFCRNVFIYFSQQYIRQVVKNFHRSLRNQGFVFVAAAESLLRITTDFEFMEIDGAFVYKKE